MTRLILTLAALFGLAAPGGATSIRNVPLPELVARADVIVIGTVLKAGDPYSAKVTETLTGPATPNVYFIIPRWQEFNLRAGATKIFFLVSGKDGLTLFHPVAYESPARAGEVRQLLDMRQSPAKYLADPRYRFAPDFLQVLGFAFVRQQKIGDLDRQAAGDHLRKALTAKDPQAIVQALAGLRLLERKEPRVVIPLLKHSDPKVLQAAVTYLGWAPDSAAVGPLCDLLDTLRPDPRANERIEMDYLKLKGRIGRALIEIGDAAAVPALERASQRGVVGMTSVALGRLGDKVSFEVLLDAVEKLDSGDAEEGLYALVRRSNKQLEPWMGKGTWSSRTGLENKGKWRAWWDANKADFKVVKTAAEAFRSEK